MIFAILAPYGIKYLLMVFGILFLCGILAGTVLNKLMRGETPELFMEIPSWQIPQWRPLLRKLWIRMKEYLGDALPLIVGGVFLVDLMQLSGLTDWLTKVLRFPVEHLLSLPAEITPVLLLGVLRKDVSIAMLSPYHLTPEQLVVCCIFMTMYLPCVATFFVMLRESGLKDTLRVVALTFGLATAAAWILGVILF